MLTKDVAYQELLNIADWWIEHATDKAFGGYVGQINYDASVENQANKGVVLNTRILWFFAEAARFTGKVEYRQAADNAYQYLLNYFDDKNEGGVFWELDFLGKIVSDKKQTYAQSFAIYALCAYYKLTNEQAALDKALEYFALIESHCWDDIDEGYIEALNGHWLPLNDVRLSEKDQNTPKSMNTHLHVLEAYTSLYQLCPNPQIKKALSTLIDLCVERIIDLDTSHLKLFFNMQWQDCSEFYSYGHDIECSWLLWEALEVLNDTAMITKYKPVVIAMAKACSTQSLGEYGQVCDEYVFATKQTKQSSDWWVQAEALVGFLNAYHLTHDPVYLSLCHQVWDFTQRYHIDAEKGEWHWQATVYQQDNDPDPKYKVGFWKAPYHNGRAMMEVCRLFDLIGD
ncbi:AGE family epimerase/isomerase [Alteromonadaceae bacterium BrNp21-10]|nr:AGE family epimerase/isomerase [Alteromonadaceae bacterium BrNp21-10]